MKQRAIVTGGAGFIGSYVVQELLREGYEIVVFDNLSTGKRERVPDQVEFILGDIREYKEIEAVIKEGDVVFHLAAFISVPKSFEEPLLSHEINVKGTYNVFEAARQKKAASVIFSSSAAIYGSAEGMVDEQFKPSPESPYGTQKYIGEKISELYHKSFGLASMCLRYFNVYGFGNNETGDYAPVTARFLKQKREGAPLTITGDGLQTRDFIHVKDVALANILASKIVRSDTEHHVINIASGTSYVINHIADLVGGEKVYVPKRNEPRHSSADLSKAKEILNWEATVNLEEEIDRLKSLD